MLGTDRVLIVAQGLEYERIMAAISLHHPTKLIILRSIEDVSTNLRQRVNKIINSIIEEIQSPQGRRAFPWINRDKIFHKEHQIDFFNLTKAIAQIDQIVSAEKKAGNNVTIDLSSGNTIIRLALYICSRLHELPTTYCVAGKYAPEQPRAAGERDISVESISFSVQKHVELPEVPFVVQKVPFDILKKIVEHEGEIDSIKALTKLIKSDSVTQSDIVKVSRRIESLEGLGYVRRKRKGRKITIQVTEKGQAVVDLAEAPSFSHA